MSDETYETSGHSEVFADADGTLHAGGAAINVKLPAVTIGSALPVADPHVAGHLWSNAGVVTVSAG